MLKVGLELPSELACGTCPLEDLMLFPVILKEEEEVVVVVMMMFFGGDEK